MEGPWIWRATTCKRACGIDGNRRIKRGPLTAIRRLHEYHFIKTTSRHLCGVLTLREFIGPYAHSPSASTNGEPPVSYESIQRP
jgi:hypothetical protein